jgi:hypothetical protein
MDTSSSISRRSGASPQTVERVQRSPAFKTATESALADYDELIRPARARFAASRGVQAMTSPQTDARTMAAFLLHFSALSVPITEPVEGWIRRAGERCRDRGLHAGAEAGHHLYHRRDCAALVSLWNQRWEPTITGADVAAATVTRGGERYCALHEANIGGDEPFCQFAIEYEIELLPVELGPAFVRNCVRVLGPDILTCMTFVTSHIEFDVGHTKFNAHFLGSLIEADPRRLPSLAAAGAAALDAFGDHLTECWELGLALASRS